MIFYLSLKMRVYKVKTYDELEREIDMYCILFAGVFCLIYVGILLFTVYMGYLLMWIN